MSVGGKFTGITRGDMLAEADRFGIGDAPKVMGQVRAAIGDRRSAAKGPSVNGGALAVEPFARRQTVRPPCVDPGQQKSHASR